MGRSPSFCSAKVDDEGLNRGAWTANEDKILSDYIKTNGVGRWRFLPKRSGEPDLYNNAQYFGIPYQHE
jgi:myb proto-oncogene protein